MNTTWKKRLIIGGISLGIILLVFIIAMCVFNLIPNTDEMLSEDAIVSEQLSPVDKASGKINILLLGVDMAGLRTDTIIVASYDLDENKINMLSIPRDTRMYVGSRYQKINAAHAISQKGGIKGPQGSIEAVTRLTGIPINYYIEFNFSTFRDVVDALGGVDFYVPRDMNYEDPVQDLYIHLKEGQQHLDGDKAEQLVRFRRYPEGDIARVRMQQSFLQALAEQKLNSSIIEKIPDLYKTFKEDIKTNFTLVDIMKYLPNVKELSSDSISMFQLPGNYNDTDYGASYWICNMTEMKKLISENFGYSAAAATIHSADGSSKSKDVVIKKTTPVPNIDKNDLVDVTPSPTPSASPSASPSHSPSAANTPSPSSSTVTMPPELSRPTPSSTDAGSNAGDSTSDNKSDGNADTPAPVRTAAPTKSPEKTTQPTKTSAPTENKVSRPTANPTVE